MTTILALVCPPLAVLRTGRPLTAVLTLALTLLFWLPGMIHAMMIVSQDHREEQRGTDPSSRVHESSTSASLALLALLMLLAGGWYFWPEFKSRFIDEQRFTSELPEHQYR